jgi:membrane protein
MEPTPPEQRLNSQHGLGIARQVRLFFGLGPPRLHALLIRAFNEWSEHNASRLGAALSYYTLFSIAPILVVTVGVVGLVYGPAAAQGEIAPWLERLFGPEGARAAQLLLAHASSPTGGVTATVVGIVSLILGASSVVNELRNSLNVVWRLDTNAAQNARLLTTLRDTFSARLYAFGIVLGAGVLIILSIAAATAVAAVGTHIPVVPMPEVTLQILNFLVTLVLMTMVFALVYKTVPDASVAWGDAAVGGLVTALLFNIGSLVLSTFVGKSAGSVYGTAGGVIALLVWVYYSAQVFFFGAEVTRIFATQYGGGITGHRRTWH